MIVDRLIDDDAGLPVGGCCCPEHPHEWYERTDGDEQWIECVHCSEVLEVKR